MELDSRILEGKKPLDCFDVDIAKQFIGKKGYFSNSLGWYSVLKRTWNGTLDDIESQKEQCFYDCESEGYFHYFLPAEWVKSEEPKEIYRAFSLNEFSELYAIGDVVTFRLKDCEVIEQSMLIGFQSSDDEDIPGNGYVLIGNCRYGFMELFNNHELKHLDHWQPFGIEVEEKE